MGILRTIEIPGRDDHATRIDRPKHSHEMRISARADFQPPILHLIRTATLNMRTRHAAEGVRSFSFASGRAGDLHRTREPVGQEFGKPRRILQCPSLGKKCRAVQQFGRLGD